MEGFIIKGHAAVSQPITQRCIAARGADTASPMVGNVIRGNQCTDAGTECFYLSQFGNGLIENNTIYGCGRAGGSRNHGIYLANAASDNTAIRGNLITATLGAGSESSGIHMNGDLSIGGDGIISGVTIEANTVYENPQNGINMDGAQEVLLQNNLVYGNLRHAVRGYSMDGAAGPARLRIVNKTLLAQRSGWGAKLSEDGGGHTIFNNVFIGANGSLCVANTNLLANFNASNDRFSADNEASLISLAAWRTRTGQDTQSLIVEAAGLFMDSGANDYRLAAGSSARDAGEAAFTGHNAPSVDIVGIERPQAARHDLGAFEAIE